MGKHLDRLPTVGRSPQLDRGVTDGLPYDRVPLIIDNTVRSVRVKRAFRLSHWREDDARQSWYRELHVRAIQRLPRLAGERTRAGNGDEKNGDESHGEALP